MGTGGSWCPASTTARPSVSPFRRFGGGAANGHLPDVDVLNHVFPVRRLSPGWFPLAMSR